MKTPSRIALSIALVAAVVCGAVLLRGTSGDKISLSESSTGVRALASSYCSCSSCTSSIWNTQTSSGSTCGTLIHNAQHSMKNLDACRTIASQYRECSVCHPDHCGTSSSSSSGGGGTSSSSSSSSSTALSIKGNNGSPSSAFPLGKCQGDCDSDSECASGLVCFQRSGTETVPGCSGSSQYSGIDFCIDPNSSSSGGTTSGGTTSSGGGTSSSNNGNLPSISMHSSFPLGNCQGDCDSNADCQSGLVCYQRSAYESVPGCNGGTSDSSSNDYCIDPYELKSIPPAQDSLHHGSGSTYKLKLYWQQGYKWQGEQFERRWCICSGDNLACTPGRRVYLTNCDVDTLATKWEFHYVSGNQFQIKDSNSNNCLYVPNDISQPIEVDSCNSGNERQALYRWRLCLVGQSL